MSRNEMSLSKNKLSTSFKPERENYFGITPKNYEKNSIKQVLKLNANNRKE